MSHVEDGLLNRPRPRAGAGKQPLVARHTEQDSQLEMLDKLTQLEASLASVKDDLQAVKSRVEARKLDGRTIVALVAIALSLTGYVLQEARSTSRLDTEIETAKARLAVVERIQAINTEGRIRTEVELQQLRQGQEEIKRLLVQHDSRIRGLTPRRQ
jgi:hypothetical protein